MSRHGKAPAASEPVPPPGGGSYRIGADGRLVRRAGTLPPDHPDHPVRAARPAETQETK